MSNKCIIPLFAFCILLACSCAKKEAKEPTETQTLTRSVEVTESSPVEPFFRGEDRTMQVELAFLGKNRNIAVGHNFWVQKINEAKTPDEVNAVASLWLGAAQADTMEGHINSAKVRLNEILKVLTERKGDPLLIASTQFRTAFLLLTEQRWAEALTYAKQSNETFERYLVPTHSGAPRKWLDWGGYDEHHVERILALHILARAYRANYDDRWQETIEKAITIAEAFEGRTGSFYQTSISLKKQLSGGH